MSLLSTTKSLFSKKSKTRRKETIAAASEEKKAPAKGFAASQKIELAPLMTEKGLRLQGKSQTAVFQVHVKATKREIAQAIWEQYKVKPLAVRTVHVRGKIRRRGQSAGFTSDWKKAYVKVKDVQKLMTNA